MRNVVRLAIGIAVSAGCLYLALRGTDWDAVAGVLTGADPVWVVAVLLIVVLTHVVRAQRWRILLRPIGEVGLYPSLSASMIGFGASVVLPFRLGELIRPALLARRVGCGFTPALSSVVVERLLDMVLVLAAMLLVSLSQPMAESIRRLAMLAAAGGGSVLAVLVVVQRNRRWAEHWLDRLLSSLPEGVALRARPAVGGILQGSAVLGDLRTSIVLVLYSALLWGTISAVYGSSLLALRIPTDPVVGGLTTMVIVSFFVFLPQAPGFVGTWQLGCVTALGLLHVLPNQAVGYSLFTWVVNMVVNLAGAGIFLAREDLTVRDLMRTAPAAAGEVAE